MISEKIYIFDTTLRDGQQTTGVDFTVKDKIAISNSLDQLGVDLTDLAKQFKLDPTIGREDEISRVIQILSRRTTLFPLPNPIGSTQTGGQCSLPSPHSTLIAAARESSLYDNNGAMVSPAEETMHRIIASPFEVG